MKNLSLKNIAIAVNGELYNGNEFLNCEIEGVVIDSRLVKEKYLFIAVKGQKVDGHDFINDVFEKGAICVISEKKLETDKPYILVESSLVALKQLAKFYRQQLDIKIIGITGSVGKTSTKEFIATVLSEKYNVYKTKGNFNNEIGLPLTVLGIRNEHEVAVLEMGISDFGEMSRLSEIANPNVCVITNIGICHLENLKDRDGILKAKTEMFDYAADGFVTVLNGDDDKLFSLKQVGNKRPYYTGIDKEYDCYAKNIEDLGILGTKCDICMETDIFNVYIKIPGVHMVRNALTAAMVGKTLGLDNYMIKEGLEKIVDAAGRVNIIKKEYTIIDDCYNANPVSMKASLDLLSKTEGRTIAVIGDMYELGKDERDYHIEIGKYAADKNINCIFVTGKFKDEVVKGIKSSENFENISLFIFDNNDDLIYNIKKFVENGDVILIKASHSMNFEKIVESLK